MEGVRGGSDELRLPGREEDDQNEGSHKLSWWACCMSVCVCVCVCMCACVRVPVCPSVSVSVCL
jgi:hypothetical protein